MLKLLWGATKLAAKATVVTGALAVKGTAATARVVYHNRETIGHAALKTANVVGTTVGVVGYGGYKAAEWGVKKAVAHRQEIGGTVLGSAQGTGKALLNVSAHAYANERLLRPLMERIAEQSAEYQRRVGKLHARLEQTPSTVGRRAVLLDTLTVGGATLADYASGSARVPAQVEEAYRLAYPDLASNVSFADEVRSLDATQLPGLVAGVKGKLFELEYVDYLNDHHLPAGYHAELAPSATQPGWDIQVLGPDGHLKDVIQAKATDSVDYVKDALERYPHIDVVTTSEVHSQLVMQGFADHVIDGGISEAALQQMAEGAVDGATVHFDWMPSSLALALVAFSAYSEEGLSAYQKSRNFGERATRSYLAYLAGGALAVATNTWWLGVLGGMGTRFAMGSGEAKRERLAALRDVVRSNDRVLRRLRS